MNELIRQLSHEVVVVEDVFFHFAALLGSNQDEVSGNERQPGLATHVPEAAQRDCSLAAAPSKVAVVWKVQLQEFPAVAGVNLLVEAHDFQLREPDALQNHLHLAVNAMLVGGSPTSMAFTAR